MRTNISPAKLGAKKHISSYRTLVFFLCTKGHGRHDGSGGVILDGADELSKVFPDQAPHFGCTER